MEVKIEEEWKEVLREEFKKSYFEQIVTFIKAEKAAGKIIYPPGALLFNAFDKTPFSKVKVVLLGRKRLVIKIETADGDSFLL